MTVNIRLLIAIAVQAGVAMYGFSRVSADLPGGSQIREGGASDAATKVEAAKTAAVAAQNTESDEALLSDIDQKVSADVPSPMQPLADPTDETTSMTSTSDQRTN